MDTVWLVFALAFFLAGGIYAGVQRAWAVVLVAVGGVLLILPRLL